MDYNGHLLKIVYPLLAALAGAVTALSLMK
jgi:hypothetical protein